MKVDFRSALGRVKPMHATNNGPAVSLSDVETGNLHPFTSNLYEFKNAGIPYARVHDASFCSRYGMEHTVDVAYIFPDFDADPTDPDNYDFTCTDHYLAACALAETEVFYRLGHRIEHEVKKYGTHPPKDFHKWAVICEHIIRHYTEGWANGFRYKMEYWEIWNEPDLRWKSSVPCPTWQGTIEQFCEFYHVAATHLKKCFPHLKIGGPSLSGNYVWAEIFLAQLKAPLDFFSWHCYGHSIDKIRQWSANTRALLDKYGFTETESILNEWNYVQGWHGDDRVYTHEQIFGLKGASFTAAAMCACQYSSVDMLMYYDARPFTLWNGMFGRIAVGNLLKGYYPFPMFNELYKLGTAVEATATEEGAYLCAAKGDGEAAILMTHFNNEDSTQEKTFTLELDGFGGDCDTEIEFYLLDETHNNELVRTETYRGDHLTLALTCPNFTCYLLKLKKK